MNGKSVLLCLAAIALLLWPLAGTAEGNEMTGVFDFENRKVRLNSGYDMPILGLGTYSKPAGRMVSRALLCILYTRDEPDLSTISNRPEFNSSTF